MNILKMMDLDLSGKKVLIREDFNVPLNDQGEITSLARIEAALPTLEFALQKGAKIILMSHLGRPEEGHFDSRFSLKPVAEALSKMLKHEVCLTEAWLDGVRFKENEIILCENVRFQKGEEDNEDFLASKMAALCDIFVMDAFAVAHRKQASTYGVAQFALVACAGPLLVSELEALGRAVQYPEHPVVAIVAGSKVSTKLKLLHRLSQLADVVIVGGGIANTFLAAAHFPIGASLCERALVEEAKALLGDHPKEKFPLPVDVVVAKEFSNHAKAAVRNLGEVQVDDLILDIGPQTCVRVKKILASAATIIWNGPVGVFEFDAFAEGTKAVAQAVSESHAFSIAGGGDTIAAIEKYGISDKVSYISTGGGAFLECLQGDSLPGVAILKERMTT